MAKIFITGSADGLGRAAAKNLRALGHDVFTHARSKERLAEADIFGDLADFEQVKSIAGQVNRLGVMDAVIHNAGVYTGPEIHAVNVIAPYVLTALIKRPKRLIYISSGMHLSGHAKLAGRSYSDSKLFVTTLAFAVARLWPDVISSAVDPGWVPTKMGGPNAPDDLCLGSLTQEWLATTDVASAGYWHHQKQTQPHPKSRDVVFQDELLAELQRMTGISLKS